MEDEELEQEVPKPKIEKVSLKEIRAEQNKELEKEKAAKQKEIDEAVDDFLAAFTALSPAEKEAFFKSYEKK